MGQQSRYRISRQQKFTRKKARKKLIAKGANITEYYYGKYYLKEASAKSGS